jgi:hypothetical protein
MRPVEKRRSSKRKVTKPSPKRGTKRARTGRDAVVKEFETRDLGADVRAARTAIVVRPRATPTSIVIEPALVAELRARAARKGIGYQTLLKMIVREHIEEY